MQICHTPETNRVNPIEAREYAAQLTAALTAEPTACPDTVSGGIIAQGAARGVDYTQEARVLKLQVVAQVRSPRPFLALDMVEDYLPNRA